MPLVKFNATRTVKDGTGTTFEAGKTYELPEDSAERWVKRGIAEIVATGKATKPKTAEAASLETEETAAAPTPRKKGRGKAAEE